ncbi:hypothetical protein ACWA1F_02005 [Flavobacterium sp. 3-218]
MKNTQLTFKDFELETIDKNAQKIIRGGGSDSEDTTNPVKNAGGGNG